MASRAIPLLLWTFFSFICLSFLLEQEVPTAKPPSNTLFQWDKVNPRTNRTYRSFSGRFNNIKNPEWGAVRAPYVRLQTPAKFDDGYHAPRGGIFSRLPSPREISNKLLTRPHLLGERGVSDLHTFYGLFMVMSMTEAAGDDEGILWNITIPRGDPWFDPQATGEVTIPFRRSEVVEGTGVPGVPASTLNEVSHFMDMAGVYGTDDCQGSCPKPQFDKRGSIPQSSELASPARLNKRHGDAVSLRAWTGGKLLIESLYDDSETMVPSQPRFRSAGDPRANKIPPNYAFWNLFTLEHNRLCDELAAKNPSWDDETLFQEARRWNVAFFQKIATREWLAALTGEPLPPYKGYNSSVDPSLDTFFSTVTFRYGHSEANSFIPRRDEAGNPVKEGDMIIRDIQWRPDLWGFSPNPSMESIFLGLVQTPQGKVGCGFVNDLRNMNTNHPTIVGMSPLTDLPSWNIQRGRDHGLPSYNDARAAFGLPRHISFSNISSDPIIVATLSQLYKSVDDIDAYVGALAEDHLPGANFGPLFKSSMIEQFSRSRDGDRYWYENPDYFSPAEIQVVYSTTLADILKRNMNITNIPTNVFWSPQRQLPSSGTLLFSIPEGYESLSLSPTYFVAWKTDFFSNAVSFDIQVATDGWFGIGFSPENNTMKGADIVLARYYKSTGKSDVLDCYAQDVGVPTQDVTLPGGKSDIFNTSLTYSNGVTRLQFSRPSVTADPWDKPLLKQSIKVIFAYNPTETEFVYHGPTRSASVSINFYAVTNRSSVVIPTRAREEVTTSNGLIITLAVLLGAIGAYSLGIFVFLIANFDHIVVRQSSSFFCVLIALSVHPSYVAIITQLLYPNTALCISNFFLMGVSFQIFFGSLFLKAWRVYHMISEAQSRLESTAISNGVILGLVGILVLIECVYLIIWSTVDPMKPTTVDVSGSDYQYMVQCRSNSDGWLIAWVASKFVLLLFGVILAAMTRKVETRFNESKYIGMSIYVVFMICSISIPLAFILRNFPNTGLVIQGFGLLIAMSSLISILFIPKILRIVGGEGSNSRTSVSTTKTLGTHHSSQK